MFPYHAGNELPHTMQPATNSPVNLPLSHCPSSIYLSQPYVVPQHSNPSSAQTWPQQMLQYPIVHHHNGQQMPLATGGTSDWFLQCALPYSNTAPAMSQRSLYNDPNLQGAIYAALLYRQAVVNGLLITPGKENYITTASPPKQRGSGGFGVNVDDGVEEVEKAIAAQHTNLSASESLAVALLATNLATN